MADIDKAQILSSRIKHLEILQNVVARMAANSAAIKRYCLVVVGIGLAAASQSKEYQFEIVVAIGVMTVIFWILDARYLQQEKWFRNMYDEVRDEDPDSVPDFRITPGERVRASSTLTGAIISWSTALLYFPLLVISVVGGALI